MTKTKGKTQKQTNVTMRVPVTMIDALKEIAPKRGFSGYQPLIKFYISEGLSRDEEIFHLGASSRLIEVLRERGVAENLLDEAAREAGLR